MTFIHGISFDDGNEKLIGKKILEEIWSFFGKIFLSQTKIGYDWSIKPLTEKGTFPALLMFLISQMGSTLFLLFPFLKIFPPRLFS